MAGIEEILDALCRGQSTVEEAAAALQRARDEKLADEAVIAAAIATRVASDELTTEDAAVLGGEPSLAASKRELTMLRPTTDTPPFVAAQPAPSPSGSSGSGSSGWRKWAESSHEGARIGVGDVLRDRFVLEESVGEGGMGLVFRARDLRREEARDRNPHVAIKVLGDDFKSHPDALISLQREARRMQQLSHPNIAQVYDFDRDGPHVYLVMELLEGETLDKLLARHANAGLPREQAEKLIEGAGNALRHAHAKGVVHSDFKPSNVFLTHGGEVKIIDFGIARIAKVSAQGEETALTVFDAGKLGAWTNAYASPEQILAAGEPDPRDDVYAFGLVAYEVLTGRHPFGRKSAVEARFREMKADPVPGLTPQQNLTLASALDFNRKQRLGDVMALVRSLTGDEPIIATRDVPRPTETAGRAAEPVPRHRKVGRTVALGIAGLLWAGFFAAYWVSRDAPSTDGTIPESEAVTTSSRPVPEATPDPVASAAARPADASVTRPIPVPPAPPERKSIAPAPVGSGPQGSQAEKAGSGASHASGATERSPDAPVDAVEPAGEVADLPAAAPPASPTAPQSGAPQLYRWVDKDGNVQFGEQPPPEYADTAVKMLDL